MSPGAERSYPCVMSSPGASVGATSEEAPPTRSRRAGVARLVYLGVVLVVLVWLAWAQRQELQSLAGDARPALLAVALAITGVQLWLTAVFWAATLRALGEPLPVATVLDASARSLLARYLPGSVWYAMGRSALLRHRVSARALGAVAVLEIGLSVVVGFVVGAGLLLAARRVAPAVGVVGLAGLVGAAAMCSPPMVNRILAEVARRRGGAAAQLAWVPFVGLLGWMVLFWATSAASFAVYLHAFPGTFSETGAPPVLEVAGAYMLARVLGMLALFAPQGLGVFEVALSSLLTTATTSGAADGPSLASMVLVVAGYRALVLVRDGVAVTVAELRHSTRRSGTTPGPGPSGTSAVS